MPRPKVEALGFDAWFRENRDEGLASGFRVARVTAVDRAGYLVRNETGEVPGEATGRLLYAAEASVDLPCFGDWVYVQYQNEHTLAIIHERFPRKTVLKPKAAGRTIHYQLIASNIDTPFIVCYCSYLKLKKESEYHGMSYVEKRRKDREFGGFVRSVMKHKKDSGNR